MTGNELSNGTSVKYPELSADYQALQNFYDNKQYHQLTVLDAIVKDRSKWNGLNMVDLFNSFISDFKNRINPVSLADLAIILPSSFSFPAICGV